VWVSVGVDEEGMEGYYDDAYRWLRVFLDRPRTQPAPLVHTLAQAERQKKTRGRRTLSLSLSHSHTHAHLIHMHRPSAQKKTRGEMAAEREAKKVSDREDKERQREEARKVKEMERVGVVLCWLLTIYCTVLH
jgi:hypothetical protein